MDNFMLRRRPSSLRAAKYKCSVSSINSRSAKLEIRHCRHLILLFWVSDGDANFSITDVTIDLVIENLPSQQDYINFSSFEREIPMRISVIVKHNNFSSSLKSYPIMQVCSI